MVAVPMSADVGYVVTVSPWYLLLVFYGFCVTVPTVSMFLLLLPEVDVCRLRSFSHRPITLLYFVTRYIPYLPLIRGWGWGGGGMVWS